MRAPDAARIPFIPRNVTNLLFIARAQQFKVNKLNKNKKVGARKLKLTKPSGPEIKRFMEFNHLMGYANGRPLCLVDNKNEIKACLLYKEVKKGSGEFEIVRFAALGGLTVSGGFSRLLNALMEEHSPKRVLSFVDLRYHSGSSLIFLGFKHQGASQGWSWADGVATYNRLACRANMDDRNLSQADHAQELGWWKIYDQGQAKFLLET